MDSNEKEVAKSINDLLDLEVERASEIIRNLAVVKPMNNEDMKQLGISAHENINAYIGGRRGTRRVRH